jgi:hypothetical protein
MSTTVLAPSGLEISSNHEDGQAMLDSLTKTTDKTPRVLVNKGAPVKSKDGDEKDETSQAASVLGKKGGKAAAEARKLETKAKPADEKPDAKEAKPADDKGKDEKAAKGKADETDDGEEKDADGKPLGKPRNDPRARIQQLARERDEAKERADRAERELQESRKASARATVPTTEERRETRPEADPGKPKLADFLAKHETYEEAIEAYQDARDQHRERQDTERRSYEEGHRKVTETITAHVDTFHERLTGLKGDDKTAQGAAFGEFMAALPDALVSKLTPSFMIPRGEDGRPVVRPGPANLITDLIIKSDKPREILEHFADDMDDFQRIAALRDPLQIAGEMAILSHSLDAATADTSSRREVSKAGSPPRSVSGTPRAAEPDLSNANFEEHMRRKQSAQK